MKKTLMLLVVLLVFPHALFAAESVFVQSVKAKIMGEPNFKSKELGVAQKGDKLAVTEKGDGWVKVTAGSVSGWVNKLTVGDAPPMDKVSIITADSANLEGKSRKRASAMTSAAAARGLSDTERKRLTDEGKANYRDLVEMEKIAATIGDREIGSFADEGGVQ